MENYCEQITLASKFLNLVESIHSNSLFWNKIIIVKHNKCFISDMQIERTPILNDIFSLLSDFLNIQKNIFQVTWSLLPLIRIYLQEDEEKVEIITNEAFTQNDFFGTNYNKFIHISLNHLTSLKNSNFNPYYSYSSILRFKIRENSEENNDIIRTYIHNIRSLFGLLCTQININIQHIIEKLMIPLVDGEEEMYKFFIQTHEMQTLKEYMFELDLNILKNSIEKTIQGYLENKTIMTNDIDLVDWVNYINDCIYLIYPYLNNERMQDELEKICMLVLISYKLATKEDRSKLRNEEMTLINDCVRIIDSDLKLEKRLKDWSIFNLIRLFSTNFTNLKIANELQTRIISTLKVRVKNFKSNTAFEDIVKNTERNLTQKHKQDIRNIIYEDSEKCKKILNFLIQSNWSVNIATNHVKPVYDEISKYILKLDKLNQII